MLLPRGDTLSARVLKRILPPVVVALLVIGVVGMLVERELSRIASEERLAQAHMRATDLAAIALDDLYTDARAWADIDLIRNGLIDTEERHRYLPILFQSLSIAEGVDARIELLDFLGRAVVRNLAKGGPALAEVASVQAIDDGATVFSLDARGLYLAVPVYLFGRPEGSLAVSMDRESLLRLFRALDQVEMGVMLESPAGQRVFENLAWREFVAAYGQPSAADRLLLRSPVATGAPAGAWISTMLIDQAGGSVLSNAVLLGGVISLLALFGISIAVVLAATSTVEPVRRFVELLPRVGKGEVSEPLPVHDDDPRELRELSMAFNETINALGQWSERFSRLLQALPVGVVVADAQTGEVILANGGMREILGWPADRLPAKTLHDVLPASVLPGSGVWRPDSAVEAWTLADETEIRRADGSSLPVQIDAIRLEIDGVECICALFADISDRRKAEAEQAGRTRAEAESRAKSALLANVSHEIRTPLNAVIGFAQLLARDASLEPLQQEQAQAIFSSGRHLLKLVNDLLELSRLEAGFAGAATLPVEFEPEHLIRDVAAMFRWRAQEKGLEIRIQADDSLPKYLCADEAKLRQVLINLLGNALKFTAAGHVAIRAAVEHEAAIGAQWLVMEVEDTGPGICTEEMHVLFEPFHQGEAGRIHGGTGLGLPISARLIQELGGELAVESAPGRGSCFRLRVPLHDRAGQGQRQAQELPGAGDVEGDAGPGRRVVQPGDSAAGDAARGGLNQLRRESIEQMLNALSEGDMAGLKRIIEEVSVANPAAAYTLRTLAEQYNYAHLEALLARQREQ